MSMIEDFAMRPLFATHKVFAIPKTPSPSVTARFLTGAARAVPFGARRGRIYSPKTFTQ